MLLNLSSDLVIVSDSTEDIVVPFHHIDKQLPSTLITFYKKNTPDKIYVLNGPGSFTNVRVGILAIQSLYVLSKESFELCSGDKLTLLYALHTSGILPRYGVVYFGQRRNLVVVDCQEQSWTIMTYSEIATHLGQSDTAWSQKDNFFIDQLIGEDFPALVAHVGGISYDYHDGIVSLKYKEKRYDITLYFTVQKNLQPFYGIEANIG